MKQQPIIDESQYRGEWIALDPDSYEVVSHHETLKQAIAQAKRKGIERPLMYSVPKSDGYFVGGSTIVAA